MASSSPIADFRCSLKLAKARAVEYEDGQMAVLPGADTIDLGRAKQLPHVVLANMLPDDKAIAAFLRQWGPLLAATSFRVKLREGTQFFDITPAAGLSEKVRVQYSDAVEAYFFTSDFILEHREILHRAWTGNRPALESLKQHVAASVGSTWTFKKGGRVELAVADAWTLICILTLNDLENEKLAMCANPECPAKYFVQKRRTQKYCEAGPCVAYGARQRANRWWRDSGNAWRKAKTKKRS